MSYSGICKSSKGNVKSASPRRTFQSRSRRHHPPRWRVKWVECTSQLLLLHNRRQDLLCKALRLRTRMAARCKCRLLGMAIHPTDSITHHSSRPLLLLNLHLSDLRHRLSHRDYLLVDLLRDTQTSLKDLLDHLLELTILMPHHMANNIPNNLVRLLAFLRSRRPLLLHNKECLVCNLQ